MLTALCSCDNLVVNFPTSLGCCSELLVNYTTKPTLDQSNYQVASASSLHTANKHKNVALENQSDAAYHVFLSPHT